MARFFSRNRRRRRKDTPSAVGMALKGLATLGVIAAFVALAVTAQQGVPGRDYKTMYIEASETGSLRGHDRVAIGGVRVGQVKSVTPLERGAKIKLQLEPGVQLPKDTVVHLRANGLLGARYVQLIPGSSRDILPDGSTLKAKPDALSATVPDALDVFDKETRGALGASVSGLGIGVLGNGKPLNDAVRVASDATVPFSGILDAIDRREGAAARLIPSLDVAMTPLAANRRELVDMLPAADTALRPFSDRKERLQETLQEAPSTLSTAQTGLDSGRRLLVSVGDLARSVHSTLPLAPPALKETTALLREAREEDRSGRTPLEHATSLLETIKPTVAPTLRVTRALRPVLPLLDKALADLGPIVEATGRYGCNIINAGITLRSMTGYGGTGTGPNGPSSQFRLQVVSSAETLGVANPAPHRDPYHDPCEYLGGEYTITPGTGIKLPPPKTGSGR